MILNILTVCRCTWRCSATAGPGWEAINYDDRTWQVPYYWYGYDSGTDGPNMDTRAGRLWEPTFAVNNAYCRGRQLRQCDLPIDRSDIYFIKTDPGTICMGMRKISSQPAAKVKCGTLCAGNSTSWYHSTEETCLPTEIGCCGYLYDYNSQECHLYTREVPRGDGQSEIYPPSHQQWAFYIPK